MNAAVLFLTSAWMAGADAAPPAAPIPAPVPAPGAVMAAPIGGCAGCGTGCGAAGCSGAYDECPNPPGRTSLFSKLHGKHGHGGCSSCGSAPVYTGFTTAAADCGCGSGGGGGLFTHLRSKFGHHKSSGCGGESYAGCGCDGGLVASGSPAGCALPPAPGAVMPAPATVQPAPMPMQKGPEAPRPETVKPKTTQLNTPAIVTPVSGPKITPPLGGSGSPF